MRMSNQEEELRRHLQRHQHKEHANALSITKENLKKPTKTAIRVCFATEKPVSIYDFTIMFKVYENVKVNRSVSKSILKKSIFKK